jgi:hypothetical protein
MRALTINSLSDLRTWIRDHVEAAGGTDYHTKLLEQLIRYDRANRPRYGDDWSRYLNSIDVVESIASGELSFRNVTEEEDS